MQGMPELAAIQSVASSQKNKLQLKTNGSEVGNGQPDRMGKEGA